MLFKFGRNLFLFGLLMLVLTSNGFSQAVLDDLEDDTKAEATTTDKLPDLATETIKIISPSKKIFILTNEKQSFSSGDYITLLLANKLVCRALVAKTNPNNLSGIKIIRIYNSTLWKQLTPNKDILVLKGDDSYFTNKEKEPEKTAVAETTKKKGDAKITSEDDLFNSTKLEGEDDLSLDENSSRHIRPDNLLYFGVGAIEGFDVDGSAKRFTSLGGSWGYQLTDNFWIEGIAGTSTVTDYPFTGLDTQLINLEFRLKYTVAAPLYSYFQPYLGYQSVMAKSPGAGVDPGDGSRTQAQLDEEISLVEKQKKSTVVFGVTVLKRIVPGWFARADLGTDIISGGLALEF
jgi:hypothetical protein